MLVVGAAAVEIERLIAADLSGSDRGHRNGLDAELGEGGGVSVGQAQRVGDPETNLIADVDISEAIAGQLGGRQSKGLHEIVVLVHGAVAVGVLSLDSHVVGAIVVDVPLMAGDEVVELIPIEIE